MLFDKEFPSGISLGGSTNRGYKLCRMSFLNLSHAIRNGLYKPLAIKQTENTISNSEIQVSICIAYFLDYINFLFGLIFYILS